MRSYDDDIAAARELFLAAIPDAFGQPALEAEAREGVSATSFRLRRHLAEAVEHAAAAAVLARRAKRDELVAEALATEALAEAILGREEATVTSAAAYALQAVTEHRRVMSQPAFDMAIIELWREELDEARSRFLALLERAQQMHDESSLYYLHVMLGQVECVAGRLDVALQHTELQVEPARQAGLETLVAYLLAVAAWTHAHAGNEVAARAAAAEALELAERTTGVPARFFAVSALGQLELARADAHAADAALAPLVAFAREQEMCEPGATWCVVDEIEALTRWRATTRPASCSTGTRETRSASAGSPLARMRAAAAAVSPPRQASTLWHSTPSGKRSSFTPGSSGQSTRDGRCSPSAPRSGVQRSAEPPGRRSNVQRLGSRRRERISGRTERGPSSHASADGRLRRAS